MTDHQPTAGIPECPLSPRKAFVVWFVSLFLVIMPLVITVSKWVEH